MLFPRKRESSRPPLSRGKHGKELLDPRLRGDIKRVSRLRREDTARRRKAGRTLPIDGRALI